MKFQFDPSQMLRAASPSGSSPEPRRATDSSRKNPTVVIADDHEIVREGIRRILTRLRPSWEIRGEAADGRQAVELVKELTPDVVILDVTMPGMSGLDAAREIARVMPASRILIYTVHDSDWLKSEIRDTGAHGYVQKSQVARDLVVAIEQVLDGKTFFHNQQS